jgi:thiol-disulfide isomerase/thioredoxin
MFQATTTVVTPARFAEGLTYSGFLEQATINLDKFAESYQSVPLTDEDIAFFRKSAALPHGPKKILALAEAWCGDVYRELPTVARIAEAAGLDLRVFFRDENPDIMDEFLSNNGKSRANTSPISPSAPPALTPGWPRPWTKSNSNSTFLRALLLRICPTPKGKSSCAQSSPKFSPFPINGAKTPSKRSANFCPAH